MLELELILSGICHSFREQNYPSRLSNTVCSEELFRRNNSPIVIINDVPPFSILLKSIEKIIEFNYEHVPIPMSIAQ